MRVENLKCPSCGAMITEELIGTKKAYCSYCGSRFAIDDEVKRTESNEKIEKTVNVTKTFIDKAAVIREERLNKESKHSLLFFAGCIILVLLVWFGLGLFIKHEEVSREGKICIGRSSEDIVGKKYKGIVSELEKIGFTNIEVVDMDDAFWFWESDTIDKITIDGDSTFGEYEYFDPSARVIISYH